MLLLRGHDYHRQRDSGYAGGRKMAAYAGAGCERADCRRVLCMERAVSAGEAAVVHGSLC